MYFDNNNLYLPQNWPFGTWTSLLKLANSELGSLLKSKVTLPKKTLKRLITTGPIYYRGYISLIIKEAVHRRQNNVAKQTLVAFSFRTIAGPDHPQHTWLRGFVPAWHYSGHLHRPGVTDVSVKSSIPSKAGGREVAAPRLLIPQRDFPGNDSQSQRPWTMCCQRVVRTCYRVCSKRSEVIVKYVAVWFCTCWMNENCWLEIKKNQNRNQMYLYTLVFDSNDL